MAINHRHALPHIPTFPEFRVFEFSETSLRYQEQLTAFMAEHIYPREGEYTAQLHSAANRYSYLPIMDELKTKAKALFSQPVPARLASG